MNDNDESRLKLLDLVPDFGDVIAFLGSAVLVGLVAIALVVPVNGASYYERKSIGLFLLFAALAFIAPAGAVFLLGAFVSKCQEYGKRRHAWAISGLAISFVALSVTLWIISG